MQISLEAMISYVPEDIHRRLKSSQLGRHFIVNLMLLFVRLTVPRRCCRDRQDTFCRLLTLTGWSWCGFSFYLIWHMWRALAFVGSERRVRFNVFCDVQQEMWLWSAGRWFQKAGKASMTPHADDDEMGTNRHWYSAYFMYNCKFPLQQWYHAPQDIHRQLKWPQLGRHCIVNLL